MLATNAAAANSTRLVEVRTEPAGTFVVFDWVWVDIARPPFETRSSLRVSRCVGRNDRE